MNSTSPTRGSLKTRILLGSAGLLGVAAVVLLALLALGVRGPNRSLLFDAASAQDILEELKPLVAEFQQECGKEVLRERFDSSTVLHPIQWCEAVEAFLTQPDADSAVQLLRAEKTHFADLTLILTDEPGPAAEAGLAIMETDCQVRPRLEKVNSLASSGGFGQFLLAVLAVLGAGVFFAFARRSS